MISVRFLKNNLIFLMLPDSKDLQDFSIALMYVFRTSGWFSSYLEYHIFERSGAWGSRRRRRSLAALITCDLVAGNPPLWSQYTTATRASSSSSVRARGLPACAGIASACRAWRALSTADLLVLNWAAAARIESFFAAEAVQRCSRSRDARTAFAAFIAAV